jgi:hypothetical protein
LLTLSPEPTEYSEIAYRVAEAIACAQVPVYVLWRKGFDDGAVFPGELVGHTGAVGSPGHHNRCAIPRVCCTIR